MQTIHVGIKVDDADLHNLQFLSAFLLQIIYYLGVDWFT